MPVRATEGTCLVRLVRMAIPLVRAAQSQCPRTGPGRPPEFADWKMAILMMVAILKRLKSKSAQYRFLYRHRRDFRRWLGLQRFPSRATYFARYARLYRLFQVGIRLQGLRACREGVATAQTVSVDKSLVAARGPQWHARDRRAQRIPKGLHGVDRDSTWSFSKHHGWVQGYSYEVVVTAARGTVLPLLASADTASVSEHVSFGPKIADLPPATRHVLADSGYDNNAYGDAVEWDDQGRRTGRRFLCAPNPRSGRVAPPADPALAPDQRRARQRRRQRLAFYRSAAGRRLYRRRSQSVEPFNEWFKSLFGLEQTVWHRGLGNNQTQLSAAVFAYQLLLRFNHRTGHDNGQIQWILDTL
jgi:hypothetical protein